jgi:hypothetical protein
MKTKEAPEKIYIDDPSGEFNDHWSVYPNDDSVEYTSTDAFIEKACDAYCKVCGHYAHSVPTHICRHDCRYFSDFKTYLKGE